MEGMSECIVIDAGSASVKAGYAGEDTPRCVFPSLVVDDPFPESSGSNHHQQQPWATGGRRPESVECHVDNVAQHPIQRGMVVEDGWEKMERLWEATLSEELHQNRQLNPDAGTGASAGYSVLLAEAPGTSTAARERTAQIMFETFKVPSLCFFNSASLSLFASGRTRGLVLECGAGVSHAVPIFEGFALGHAIRRSETAGADVTQALATDLRRHGLNLNYAVLRDVKEKLCRVDGLQNRRSQLPGGNGVDLEYELPDGTMVKIPASCQTAASEVLFQSSRPESSGKKNAAPGVHELVSRAISMCDRDLQADMRAAVVLSGGTTMLPGFCTRVKEELVRAFPDDSLRVVPGPNPSGTTERGYNSQRKHAAWIGGSMFASLETYKEVRVLKQEWEDDEHVVHRKAF